MCKIKLARNIYYAEEVNYSFFSNFIPKISPKYKH